VRLGACGDWCLGPRVEATFDSGEALAEKIRQTITTTPNDLCAELHNRMPVVLGPQVWPQWLGEELTDLPRLKALLAPYPAPVGTRVGSVKNNDPTLIEPVALSA
jgi:putative SOS response-associated peptidase YedK